MHEFFSQSLATTEKSKNISIFLSFFFFHSHTHSLFHLSRWHVAHFSGDGEEFFIVFAFPLSLSHSLIHSAVFACLITKIIWTKEFFFSCCIKICSRNVYHKLQLRLLSKSNANSFWVFLVQKYNRDLDFFTINLF
jgi:hypothetical protein